MNRVGYNFLKIAEHLLSAGNSWGRGGRHDFALEMHMVLLSKHCKAREEIRKIKPGKLWDTDHKDFKQIEKESSCYKMLCAGIVLFGQHSI